MIEEDVVYLLVFKEKWSTNLFVERREGRVRALHNKLQIIICRFFFLALLWFFWFLIFWLHRKVDNHIKHSTFGNIIKVSSDYERLLLRRMSLQFQLFKQIDELFVPHVLVLSSQSWTQISFRFKCDLSIYVFRRL